MKITYRCRFISKCPANGKSIDYELVIESVHAISVDHITAACALHHEGYHEQIAADLAEQFPGTRQTLAAHHHGVDIETVCE